MKRITLIVALTALALPAAAAARPYLTIARAASATTWDAQNAATLMDYEPGYSNVGYFSTPTNACWRGSRQLVWCGLSVDGTITDGYGYATDFRCDAVVDVYLYRSGAIRFTVQRTAYNPNCYWTSDYGYGTVTGNLARKRRPHLLRSWKRTPALDRHLRQIVTKAMAR